MKQLLHPILSCVASDTRAVSTCCRNLGWNSVWSGSTCSSVRRVLRLYRNQNTIWAEKKGDRHLTEKPGGASKNVPFASVFENYFSKSCFCISIGTISHHQLAALRLIQLCAFCSVSDQTCGTEYVTLHKRRDLRQLNIEKAFIFTGSYLKQLNIEKGFIFTDSSLSEDQLSIPMQHSVCGKNGVMWIVATFFLILCIWCRFLHI